MFSGYSASFLGFFFVFEIGKTHLGTVHLGERLETRTQEILGKEFRSMTFVLGHRGGDPDFLVCLTFVSA